LLLNRYGSISQAEDGEVHHRVSFASEMLKRQSLPITRIGRLKASGY
jgi:hypothetical protein